MFCQRAAKRRVVFAIGYVAEAEERKKRKKESFEVLKQYWDTTPSGLGKS
jgi:hypothetical protein